MVVAVITSPMAPANDVENDSLPEPVWVTVWLWTMVSPSP